MSLIDLFLIGFIVEKPWNAYELAKFIEGHDLQEIIRISTPSIYKNLTKLAQKGYLEVQISKEGGRPEKKIYSITEQGKAYFLELLHKAATLPVYYHFSCNTVVMHLNKVEKDEGLQLLDVLRSALAQKQIGVNKAVQEHGTEIPLVGRAIIRQVQLVNEAMIQWLDEFIEHYRRE
jgi:DNA-binding PadR family transcriptional regulator